MFYISGITTYSEYTRQRQFTVCVCTVPEFGVVVCQSNSILR